jgi:hypothetical protein
MVKQMGKDKIALTICFSLVVALAGFSALSYLGAKGLESKVSGLESRTSDLETEIVELNEKVQNLTDWRDALMSGLNFTFIGTEQARISYVQWPDATHIYITVDNEGTAVVTLNRVYVNNVLQGTHNCTDASLDPGESKLFSITYAWAAGQTYDITVETAQNNKFSTVATPPG